MNRVKIVPIVIPPTSTRPIELRALAPAPVTKTSGIVAGDGGDRRHQDWPESDSRRLRNRCDFAYTARAEACWRIRR